MGDPLSKDPVELRADLRAALDFALGDSPSEGQKILADVAVESLESYDDSYTAIELVLSSLGAEVFGRVLLHAIREQTALVGFAESTLYFRNLSALGITMRDLNWPDSELQWPWKDEALIEDGIEILSAVDFSAAEARAVGLGYGHPSLRAIVEHHLVEHRFHSPEVAAVRAGRDGISSEHWASIIEAFSQKELVHG